VAREAGPDLVGRFLPIGDNAINRGFDEAFSFICMLVAFALVSGDLLGRANGARQLRVPRDLEGAWAYFFDDWFTNIFD